MKNKFNFKKVLIVLFIAVVCAVPGVFFFVTINQISENKELAKTGKEVIADPVDYGSDKTVNDIEYFYIIYEYDVGGHTHKGKTSSKYLYHEVKEIMFDNAILIKYNDRFESIEADYQPDYTVSAILAIFLGVDVVLWIATVVEIIKQIKYARLDKTGKEYNATYLNSTCVVVKNGVSIYKIGFYYYDHGRKVKQETDAIYTSSEVEIIKQIKKFKVITDGKVGRIVTDLADMAEELESTITTCQYCGANVDKTKDHCSSCKALLKKDPN